MLHAKRTPRWLLAALLVSLLAPFGATAAPFSLDILSPIRQTGPGATLTFFGSISNTSGTSLDSASLFLDFAGYDPSVLGPVQDLGPGTIIADGATSALLDLFSVIVDPAALAGTYPASVTLQDDAGDLAGPVDISVTVPEPGMLLLFGSIGVLLLAARRRGHAAGLLAVSLLVAPVARAATSPVQLVTTDIAASPWSTDPTRVGVSIRLHNAGSAVAANVQVTRIVVNGGSFSGGVPIALGTLNSGDDHLVPFVVTVPASDGRRILVTLEGTYATGGITSGFSITRAINPNAAPPGPILSRSGVAVIQNPQTALYPPPRSPITRPFNEGLDAPNPVPPGPPRLLFAPTPSPSGIQPGPAPGNTDAPVIIPINNTDPGTTGSAPPDPTTASAGLSDVELGAVTTSVSAYNTIASYSTNGGATFTDVPLTSPIAGEPGRTSFFPQSDGGLCCDQVVIYVPGRDLFVWLQQYWNPTDATGNVTGPNRLRVAWARPADVAAGFDDAWTYADLNAVATPGVSGGLGLTGNASLDYPDLGYSNGFLYVAVNHVGANRIVARMSLNDMTNPAATAVNYSYAELGAGTAFNHLVTSTPDRLVLGSFKDGTTLRVYTWPDSSGTIANTEVPISAITFDTSNANAPDGQNWVAQANSGVVTSGAYRLATVFGGPSVAEYVLAFSSGPNGTGRPRPYVRLETMRPTGDTTYSAVAEYDIFNPDYAFAQTGIGFANDQIQLGLNVVVGGGTAGYPHSYVGFENDFVVWQTSSANGLQQYLVNDSAKRKPGSAGYVQTIRPRYGDWFHVRPVPSTTARFATEVYDVSLPAGSAAGATCLTSACTATPRYVEFGRPISKPPIIH